MHPRPVHWRSQDIVDARAQHGHTTCVRNSAQSAEAFRRSGTGLAWPDPSRSRKRVTRGRRKGRRVGVTRFLLREGSGHARLYSLGHALSAYAVSL